MHVGAESRKLLVRGEFIPFQYAEVVVFVVTLAAS